MADKIIFEIDVKGAEGIKTIQSLKNELANLQKQASTTDIGSSTFKTLQANIASVNGELKNLNQGFKSIDGSKIAPVAGTMAAIKQEVKDLKKELEGKALGSKEFDELQAKLQTANAKFREFKEDIKGFKPEELLKGVTAIGASIAGSFAVAQGVLSSFGVESKAVAEAEAKAQGAIAIAVGASTIAREVDNASKLVAYGQSKLLAASLFLEKTATEGGTVARVGATIAQKALNFAMAANPIGVVLVAVVALTGAFIAFASATDKAAEAQKAIAKVNEDNARYDKIFLDNLNKSAEATRADYARRIVELEGLKGKEAELAKVKQSSAEFEARLQKAISDNVKTNEEYNKSVQTTLNLNAQKQNAADKEAQRLAEEAQKRTAEEEKFLADSLSRQKKYQADLAAARGGSQNEQQQIESERLTAIDELNAVIVTKQKEIADNEILTITQKNELIKGLEVEKNNNLLAINETANQDLFNLAVKSAEDQAKAQSDIDAQALETRIQQEQDAQTIILQTKLDALAQDEQINGQSLQSITDITDAKIKLLQDQQVKETEGLSESSALRYAIEQKYTNQIVALKTSETRQKIALQAAEDQAALAGLADVAKQASSIAKKGSQEQRALTLISIALSTAAGIAGAVKAASTASNTYEMIADIAAGIAAVLAGISQAKDTFSSSGAGYAEGGYVSNKGKRNYSDGGAVFGAGSSTSDSIPARLSDGEFVVKSSSVQKVGVPFLNAINSGFASGGLVPSNTASLSSGGVTITSISPQLEDIKYILLNQNERPVKTYVVDQEMTSQQTETATIQRRARF